MIIASFAIHMLLSPYFGIFSLFLVSFLANNVCKLDIMAEYTHAINWFEIPVNDFDRARKFYETILGYTMKAKETGGAKMAFFAHDVEGEGRGGAIVYDPAFYTPNANGTLVYLNCENGLQDVLDRVVAAGGEILQNKTPVGITQDMGSWGLIKDTEGNRVALHATDE